MLSRPRGGKGKRSRSSYLSSQYLSSQRLADERLNPSCRKTLRSRVMRARPIAQRARIIRLNDVDLQRERQVDPVRVREESLLLLRGELPAAPPHRQRFVENAAESDRDRAAAGNHVLAERLVSIT